MAPMPARPRPPSRPAPAGFTLIEVVVVLLIFGVVVAMAALITRGVVAAQKRSLTATRMAALDEALVQFVLQRRRLPCPADGTLVSSHNSAGIEARSGGACQNNQQNGVTPWRTLGLTETDATDGWERRITYRVGPTLAADGGMDMSWCDPAGQKAGTAPQACDPTCAATALGSCTPPSLFLGTRGLEVRNLAGVTIMNPNPGAGDAHTGAAYVLISAGESGGGAYLNSGVLATSTVGDGTEEARNYASLAYAGVATFYVDDTLNETGGATHFDDVLSRPSVLSVATRAGLGPRAH